MQWIQLSYDGRHRAEGEMRVESERQGLAKEEGFLAPFLDFNSI